MAISSPGIGSGLDVKSIVSQLVELEKKPLTQLQTRASDLKARLSAYGQLKSQIANLQDQAAKLASPGGWSGMTLSSSNSAAVSGTASATAAATRFSVNVSQIARAQSTDSVSVTKDAAVGAGRMSIGLGKWNGSAFAQTGSAVNVDIDADDDMADIAGKINAANAGVTATVLRDDAGERLLIQSKDTGVSSGFRIQVADANGAAVTNGTGLGRLAYDPQSGATGMNLSQAALDTQATVNGVSVSSATNELKDAVPGVNLSFLQVTTAPVEVTVGRETITIRNNINSLVESYNALSNALKEMTKYNPGDKTAGTLQGESTAVGLQNALRRALGNTGPFGNAFGRLSDVGVEFQQDGTLKVNAAKLTEALKDPESLKSFFSTEAGANGIDGLAVRIRDFAQGLLGADGSLTSKNNSLQSAIDRNLKEQDRVSDRITRTEARLLAQYSRLDTTLSKLTALNSYVAQQVTSWNNQGDN